MIIWACESYTQVRCCICSHSIENTMVRWNRRHVSGCSAKIESDLAPLRNHGFTATHRKLSRSRNREFLWQYRRPRRPMCVCQPTKPYRQFLWCSQYYQHLLLSKEMINQCRILGQPTESIQWQVEEKRPNWFKKNYLS